MEILIVRAIALYTTWVHLVWVGLHPGCGEGQGWTGLAGLNSAHDKSSQLSLDCKYILP